MLQADHSISCDSAEYNGFWYGYASFMVVVRANEPIPSTRTD